MKKLVLISLLALISISCSSLQNINSISKKDLNITVDGDDSDWKSNVMYFEEQKLSLGVANDDAKLYICFKTNNRIMKRKIRDFGLTIWLNSSASSDKSFGINYPTGRMRDAFTKKDPPTQSMNDDEEKSDRDDYNDVGTNEMKFCYDDDSKDFLIPAKSITEKYGIQAKFSRKGEFWIYEISIPMGKNNSYNISANAEGNIGIGIMPHEIEKMEFSRNSGRQSLGGGMGGDMGMNGGRRGNNRDGALPGVSASDIPDPSIQRGRGGNYDAMSEHQEFWYSVKLAK